MRNFIRCSIPDVDNFFDVCIVCDGVVLIFFVYTMVDGFFPMIETVLLFLLKLFLASPEFCIIDYGLIADYYYCNVE